MSRQAICRGLGAGREGVIAMCSTRKAQTEAGQVGSVGVPLGLYTIIELRRSKEMRSRMDDGPCCSMRLVRCDLS